MKKPGSRIHSEGSKDIRVAAAKRQEAAAEVEDPKRAQWILALEKERRGYQSRGLTDRVKQVDEQLAIARGKKTSSPVEDIVDEPVEALSDEDVPSEPDPSVE